MPDSWASLGKKEGADSSWEALNLESFADALRGLKKCGFDFFLDVGSHARGGGGDADGGDNGLRIVPQSGTKTDASSDGFLTIGRDAGATGFFKFGEEFASVDDGVFGTGTEAVDLEDAVGERAILKGGDDLAHGAAVGRQDAADLVRHADFVERFDAVEDVDAIVVEVGEADGLVEGAGEALDLRACDNPQMVRGLHQPAEDEFRSELIRAIPVLVEIFVLLKRQKDTEERRLGQAHSGADVFKRERCLAIEAVQDFERAADGAEVVLPIGGRSFAGLEGPLRNASSYGFLSYSNCPIGCFVPHIGLGPRSRLTIAGCSTLASFLMLNFQNVIDTPSLGSVERRLLGSSLPFCPAGWAGSPDCFVFTSERGP
jgi:hypothetical protein